MECCSLRTTASLSVGLAPLSSVLASAVCRYQLLLTQRIRDSCSHLGRLLGAVSRVYLSGPIPPSYPKVPFDCSARPFPASSRGWICTSAVSHGSCRSPGMTVFLPGAGRFDVPSYLLPRCWREKSSGTTDVMGRMLWDAPSLTIRTEFFKPEKGRYLHPQWDQRDAALRVNRVITHLEAALLQDFPDDFLWCGSKIGIARQIGNAVPVGLAAALARRVREAL